MPRLPQLPEHNVVEERGADHDSQYEQQIGDGRG